MRREEVLQKSLVLAKGGKEEALAPDFHREIGRLFKCHTTGVFTMILTSIRQRKMRVVS